MEQLFGKLSQWKTKQKDRKRKPYAGLCSRGERVDWFKLFLPPTSIGCIFQVIAWLFLLVCPCRKMISSQILAQQVAPWKEKMCLGKACLKANFCQTTVHFIGFHDKHKQYYSSGEKWGSACDKKLYCRVR